MYRLYNDLELRAASSRSSCCSRRIVTRRRSAAASIILRSQPHAQKARATAVGGRHRRHQIARCPPHAAPPQPTQPRCANNSNYRVRSWEFLFTSTSIGSSGTRFLLLVPSPSRARATRAKQASKHHFIPLVAFFGTLPPQLTPLSSQLTRPNPRLDLRRHHYGAHELPDPVRPRPLPRVVPPESGGRRRGLQARHDSAEYFCRLKARRCTASHGDSIFIPAYCFAIS